LTQSWKVPIRLRGSSGAGVDADADGAGSSGEGTKRRRAPGFSSGSRGATLVDAEATGADALAIEAVSEGTAVTCAVGASRLHRSSVRAAKTPATPARREGRVDLIIVVRSMGAERRGCPGRCAPGDLIGGTGDDALIPRRAPVTTS
jgi:hypothetical protein